MNLFEANTFQSFWGIPGAPSPPEEDVRQHGRDLLSQNAEGQPTDWQSLMALVLGEQQFGEEHFGLKGLRRLYYEIRPALPSWSRSLLHKAVAHRQKQGALLTWPVEDRYVAFQFELMRAYIFAQGRHALPHVRFWPFGKDFAFVLTHDIESGGGQQFARDVADLEEKHDFRSSFNFVPEKYEVDHELMAELRSRGFEVGVHGLKHDGSLFSSRKAFDDQVRKINGYLATWNAVGFRSPFTHRDPEWMQALEIEYDSSFFDTDPFEPIPGGTMSIWPFRMGRFIELPYTLVQDHTLMLTLAETTPRIWLEKVAFIRRFGGMAMVNVHPDYMRNPECFAVYAAFLAEMSETQDYWHARPREVARWWKKRMELDRAATDDDGRTILPGLTMGGIDLPPGGTWRDLELNSSHNQASSLPAEDAGPGVVNNARI